MKKNEKKSYRFKIWWNTTKLKENTFLEDLFQQNLAQSSRSSIKTHLTEIKLRYCYSGWFYRENSTLPYVQIIMLIYAKEAQSRKEQNNGWKLQSKVIKYVKLKFESINPLPFLSYISGKIESACLKYSIEHHWKAIGMTL